MTSIQRRALLLGSASLALLPGIATARVGVIAAVAGDPRGQAAAASQRILRAGIDIEVGETIETGGGEFVNIAFLDGTSLTVAPNSAIRIDRFSFSPEGGRGELAFTTGGGQYRLISGRIGETGEITIATPSGTIAAQRAIFACSVSPRVALAFVLEGRVRKTEGVAMPGGFPAPTPLTAAAAAPDAGTCFTLIEVLAVVSVIGVLFALALPAVAGALTRAQATQILSNMKQLHLATQQMSLDATRAGISPAEIETALDETVAMMNVATWPAPSASAEASESPAVENAMAHVQLEMGTGQLAQRVRTAAAQRSGSTRPMPVSLRISTIISNSPVQHTVTLNLPAPRR